jgi:hypothetical protein
VNDNTTPLKKAKEMQTPQTKAYTADKNGLSSPKELERLETEVVEEWT